MDGWMDGWGVVCLWDESITLLFFLSLLLSVASFTLLTLLLRLWTDGRMMVGRNGIVFPS